MSFIECCLGSSCLQWSHGIAKTFKFKVAKTASFDTFNWSWVAHTAIPHYLRSSYCFLFGTLTGWWFSRGPTSWEVLPLIYPLPDDQHIKNTTQSSPRTCRRLNKEVSHLAQTMVIKGSEAHWLSLVAVSSWLGHTISTMMGELTMNITLTCQTAITTSSCGVLWLVTQGCACDRETLVALVGARHCKCVADM